MAELGGALVLTDDDLERLSTITDQDLVNANIAWTREAARWAKNLLLADQPEENKGS